MPSPALSWATLTLATIALGAAAAAAERRMWADDTGKYSIEAELLEIRDGSTVLKRSDGSTVAVPMRRLSDADWNYLWSLERPPLLPISRDTESEQPSFPDALIKPPSWYDANTPFDLAEFLKPPPPEENAASLYLDALFEFSDEMAYCYDAGNPKAYSGEVLQRFLLARNRSKQGYQFEEAWEKSPESVSAEAVDAWLTNYDAGFEKLAAAQQRPKCVFQTGYSFHSLLPHNQVARQVARVVRWRTRRDLQRGDFQRPLRDLKMQLRLNRDLQTRGVLVAQLVVTALNDQCFELVRTILNTPGVDVAHCDRLLALLAQHEAEAINALVEGNRAEYIVSRQALHDLQHRTGTFDPKVMRDELEMEGDVTSPLAGVRFILEMGFNSPQEMRKRMARFQGALLPGAWTGGKMLSDEDYAKEVAAVDEFFAAILALGEESNGRRLADANLEAAEALALEKPLAALVIPPQGAVIQAIRRSAAHLRGVQCLVAMRRWQLQHAGAPPDLSAIVKEAGVPDVPIDPYSDGPLRMAFVASEPVIYSVGPDGKDDKAQVEWDYGTRNPGDFIFQLDKQVQ